MLLVGEQGAGIYAIWQHDMGKSPDVFSCGITQRGLISDWL